VQLCYKGLCMKRVSYCSAALPLQGLLMTSYTLPFCGMTQLVTQILLPQQCACSRSNALTDGLVWSQNEQQRQLGYQGRSQALLQGAHSTLQAGHDALSADNNTLLAHLEAATLLTVGSLWFGTITSSLYQLPMHAIHILTWCARTKHLP